MRAWAGCSTASSPTSPGGGRTPYTDADYFAHVDGKPRYDGVRDLPRLARHRAARGRPDDDPPDAETVGGLGNRKNDAFNAVLERDGVERLPRLGRAARPPARPGHCRRGRLVLAQRARRARGGRSGGPLRGRRRRRGRRRARPPRQAGPRHLPARRASSSACRGRARRRARGRPVRRRGRAAPATSASSSGSTGERARSALLDGGADVVVADLDELVPVDERHRCGHAGPPPRPARPHRFPVDEWALVETCVLRRGPRRHRDALRRRQRLPRDARQPRGGPRRRTRTAPSSTASTRRGRSGTPRRPSASPRPARPSSTSPTSS